MSFIENLSWRYATKKFTSEDISEDQLKNIQKAIQFSPSSKNLQPYHVVIIPRGRIRETLALASTNESQILTASYIFVFCSRTDLEQRAEDLIENTAKTQETTKEALTPYYQSILDVITSIPEDKRKSWTARYMFIALGFALASCAEMNIDSCPMEGFDNEKWKEILSLPAYLHPQALLAVGFRGDSPRPKVRFPENDLFSLI